MKRSRMGKFFAYTLRPQGGEFQRQDEQSARAEDDSRCVDIEIAIIQAFAVCL
jgi:hypothetical protein